MKRTPTYFGSYNKYKTWLIKNKNATKFRNVHRVITSIDNTLVVMTRFQFRINDKRMYGAIEPETGFFDVSERPIKNIT